AHLAPGSDRIDIADHFNDTRTLGLESLLQRVADVSGVLDQEAFCSHGLSDGCETDVSKFPQLTMIPYELSTVSVLVNVGLHVDRGIVVYQQDSIDVPSHGCLELAEVIPKAPIPGKQHYRPLRNSQLGPQGGRQAPAQRTGCADVALTRPIQIEHRPRP